MTFEKKLDKENSEIEALQNQLTTLFEDDSAVRADLIAWGEKLSAMEVRVEESANLSEQLRHEAYLRQKTKDDLQTKLNQTTLRQEDYEKTQKFLEDKLWIDSQEKEEAQKRNLYLRKQFKTLDMQNKLMHQQIHEKEHQERVLLVELEAARLKINSAHAGSAEESRINAEAEEALDSVLHDVETQE